MTKEEQSALKAMIVGHSAYYSKKLDDHVVVMYVNDLLDMSLESIRNAFVEYRRNPKNRSMPLAADIRALADPKLQIEDEATITVSKLLEAISRFGYTNQERAMDYIGELGRELVKSEGGWENVCQTVTNDNKMIFRSQMMTLAKSLAIRNKQEPKVLTTDQPMRYLTQEKEEWTTENET